MTSTLADVLFTPKSIAVYGASSDRNKLSGRPLDYLKEFRFPGEIVAINPNRDEVQGVPAHPSIAASGAEVDLAVVVVPQARVMSALEDCAASGVKAAIVFASGFGEMGKEGRVSEEAIAELVRRTGMRVIGPNCLGAFSLKDKTFATFSTAFDEDASDVVSPIALATQSGAVGTFAFSEMSRVGLGVRVFANTGNEADVDVCEILQSLIDHPEVELLMGHFENGDDVEGVRALASAARAAGKSLLIIKGGRTAAGARAVDAHTGSSAGDFDAFRAAAESEGAVVVTAISDWVDAALLSVGGRSMGGERLTILTQSGGSAALAADEAVSLGLRVDTWESESDRRAVADRLPGFASTLNPIDLTGAMLTDPESLRTALAVATANSETDAVLVVLGNSDRTADVVVRELIAAHAATDKPFLVSWTGGNGGARARLLAAGVPAYTDPSAAARAVSRLRSATALHGAVSGAAAG